MKITKRRKSLFVVAAAVLLCAGLFSLLQRSRTPAVPIPKFSDEGCRQAYLKLYERPQVDLKVIFGYKDARPARFVADRYERMIFVQRLLQKCRGKDSACGFTRVSGDADLFTRQVTGPDGKPRTIYLRAIQSSAGPDDEENRNDPFQKWRSRYATLAFLQGLSDADTVFYNGHSRGGGGPDFEPPRLGARQDVAFSWYQENQPGFNSIVDTFQGRSSRLKLLGLYSCASTRHFLERVQKVNPGLGLITSPKLIYFSDALESSLDSLSALLAMKCESGFRSVLNSRNSRASGAQVSGFFEEEDSSQ